MCWEFEIHVITPIILGAENIQEIPRPSAPLIQPHLPDVLRHRRIHPAAQRLADRGSLADRSRRGRLMQISQQMDGRSFQYEVSGSPLLVKWSSHLGTR